MGFLNSRKHFDQNMFLTSYADSLEGRTFVEENLIAAIKRNISKKYIPSPSRLSGHGQI